MRARIEGLDETIRAIRRLGIQYPEITQAVTKDVTEEIVMRLESETVSRTPAGVGGAAGLRGSIFGEVRHGRNSVSGIWGSPLKYGEIVELGRRPGKMPPVAPLALWARRKLGVSAASAGSVGFAIALKIKHHGFQGAHMFENAWAESEDWVRTKIAMIPEKIMRRVDAGN